MKIIFPFLFLLSSIIFSQAQTSEACQELLMEEFSLSGLEMNPSQAQKIVQFNECFLDSIDVMIFWNATILTPFVISDAEKRDSIKTTFKDLLEHFYSIKEMDFYQDIKDVYDDLAIIADLKVVPENWNLVESVLQHAKVPTEKIEEIHSASLFGKNINLTYKELLKSLKKEEESTKVNSGLEPPTESKVDRNKFYAKSNFDYSALIAQSKNEGKPLLFYFTGYGCINAAKMESKVLNHSDIQELINQNFILVPLYVDDKMLLPEEETTKEGRTLKTVGQRNGDFQIANFQSNHQPYFVIMNGEELILNKIGYVDKESFKQFLTGEE